MFHPGDWTWSLEHRQDCRIAQEDNVWEACDQVEQHNRLLAEPAPV